VRVRVPALLTKSLERLRRTRRSRREALAQLGKLTPDEAIAIALDAAE
jgi:hypothetical protein